MDIHIVGSLKCAACSYILNVLSKNKKYKFTLSFYDIEDLKDKLVDVDTISIPKMYIKINDEYIKINKQKFMELMYN